MTHPVAVIFGGSKGIGAATAGLLAKEGYAVMIVARNISDCQKLVKTLRREGLEAQSQACDIADPDQVAAVIAKTLSVFGRLDVIINSAGVMDPIAMIDDCDAEEWGRCITVNLTGAFHIFSAILPYFKTRKKGVIINLSSGASANPLRGWSAYCTAKAGLAMLTRCVTAENATLNIYNFQPGMVNTELTRKALACKINRIAEELDPENFDPPEVAAEAIAWLCRHCPEDLKGKEVILTDPKFRKRMAVTEGDMGEI